MTANGRWAALGIVVALLAACHDTTVSPNETATIARDTTALFQTDSLAYTLIHRDGAYSTNVNVTLTNRSGAAIYISNCHGATGIYLQKQTPSGWQIVRSPVLPACLGPPIIIVVGDAQRFDINLVGGEPGSNLAPQYTTTDLDGEYRLLWDGAFASYDDKTGTGAPMAEASRVSNRFLVRVKSQ
ncbi:MAG TPA: hypothetical protein VI259_22985 [Gemmatimonadaceae bacterium]